MKHLLSESSYLLEKALFILQDGICIIESDLSISYINSAGQDLLGKQLGSRPVLGDHLMDAIPVDRRSTHEGLICRAFRGETCHMTTQHSNGASYEISYYPLPDESGTVSHICIRAKDVTEKMQLEKRLTQEKKEKRDKLIKATIEAQENERSLIGRELHDNVNQVLTTVKLYTELCYFDEKPNKELLKRSLQQINYCIEEIRALSKRLAVPRSNEMNLKELIKDLVDTINITRKTSIEFRSFGIDREYSHELQTTIYRIVQEQLTNVIKYAHASSVEVIIAGNQGEIAVQVQDNGIGFDMNEKKNGNGITNMISRAAIMGGNLRFETSPGHGCIMTAEFPFHGSELSL